MPTWKNILTEASTSATNLTSIGTLTSLQVDNINVNANTISSTNTNGNVLLAANGTGKIEVRGNTNSGAVILNCENNSHGVTLQAPAHSDFSGDYTLTLPINDGDANQFLKTNGSGVLSWDDPAALTVAQGGTGATSFADKAVLITQDSGTDTVSAAAMSSNGQLLIGGTSGPAVATLTAGSNITITNADGSITIASSGGGGSGIASVSEDSTPTLGGDLIVGSNDIKSVGDVEVVVDSDSNTSDSSFTVKNGAGTILFKVNESGVTSGLLTTTAPTTTLGSSFQQGASVTGTVDNFDSDATYVAAIYNSSGTEQTSNPVTVSGSGGISFTAPNTVAQGYELRITASKPGKFTSAEVVDTFAIVASTTFTYWRLQGVDSGGNNTSDRFFMLDVQFFTGLNKTGTEYPTADLTTDSGGGVNVTSGYEHSNTSYADWKAFDNSASTGHWTIGNSVANNNWLQVEFTGGSTNLQSIGIRSNTTYHDCDGLKLMGSNTGDFTGEEVTVVTITGNDTTSSTSTNF